MFKRKSSSAVLLGSAAAFMAACSAQNTAKAINVLDVLKAPWVAERWLSYDSWVGLSKMFTLAEMFVSLPVLCLAALWVAYNGLIIAGIYSVVKGARDYSKQRESKAMLEKLNEDKTKVDEFAKKMFKEEDFSFIEKVEEKYGKKYSDSLKENFLIYLLKCEVGSETKSCEEYFKDFVLDHPETYDHFKQYKDNAEKDYGLIGPKVVTKEDKDFIDKELPKLTDELGFLKKKRSFKNDEDIFKNFLSSYVEYCHLCNKRSKEEKEKDNLDSNSKDRNSLSAKEYFFGAYMNSIPAEKAIKGFSYLISGGNDYSVSNYWIEEDENYGLTYKNKFICKRVLNYVSNEEYDMFNKMLRKASGKETDGVKDRFKNYVFYLHECNKNFKKAEKGFKDFCEESKISFENLNKVTAENNS